MEKTRTYRILVDGTISPEWSSRLSGLKVTPRTGADGRPLTELVGELRDQAALAGVLDTLYRYHLPIESLSCCAPEAGGEPTTEQESRDRGES